MIIDFIINFLSVKDPYIRKIIDQIYKLVNKKTNY